MSSHIKVGISELISVRLDCENIHHSRWRAVEVIYRTNQIRSIDDCTRGNVGTSDEIHIPGSRSLNAPVNVDITTCDEIEPAVNRKRIRPYRRAVEQGVHGDVSTGNGDISCSKVWSDQQITNVIVDRKLVVADRVSIVGKCHAAAGDYAVASTEIIGCISEHIRVAERIVDIVCHI